MKTVTVKGVGRASAPVDTVELSFRLWARDPDYDKALEAADKKVSALEQALCAAGFPAEDFQTMGFHVNAEYESVCDGNNEFRTVFAGYNCSYDQLLRFGFDAARLGEALNAAAAIGMADKLGSIDRTKQADLVIWDAPDLNYLCYRLGSNLVHTVIKKGEIYHG